MRIRPEDAEEIFKITDEIFALVVVSNSAEFWDCTEEIKAIYSTLIADKVKHLRAVVRTGEDADSEKSPARAVEGEMIATAAA